MPAHALLVAAGLLPLAAMLAALFAAVWIREGERESGRARPLPHVSSR